MRFGLNTSDPARLRAARTWGYDFAEIGGRAVVPFEQESAWQARRRLLLDAGFPLTHLAGFIPPELPFVGPDVDWPRLVAYLETCIGRAAEVGVRVFNWGSTAARRVPPGWPLSRALEQIEQTAQRIADVMAPLGCVAGIEPINPRECNILYYLTDAAHIAGVVQRPQIGVLADYFHMALQNEPFDHLGAVRDRLVHVHTSGPDRRFPGPSDPWDHAAFLRALRRVGYDGTLSFESYRLPPGADFGAEAAAALAFMRALWDRTNGEAATV